MLVEFLSETKFVDGREQKKNHIEYVIESDNLKKKNVKGWTKVFPLQAQEAAGGRQPDLAPPLLLFPSTLARLLVREAQPLVKGLRALQEAPTQHMRVTRVTHRSQQSLLGHAQAWHSAVTS